jgi:chemotaxis protein MotB
VDDLQKQLADMTGQKKTSDDQLAATNARLNQIQAELDSLQQTDAQKDAQLQVLNAKVAALTKTNNDLSANLESLRSGSTKSQADYLAQINALNKDKAALQDKVNELDKERAALEIEAQKDQKDLDARIAQLKSLFAAEIARGDLDIRRFRDVLIVSVKDSVLFGPDSPKLRPASFSILNELAGVFKNAPDRIVRVEGNTAVAVSSPETLRLYPTSWHLGAARAANVVQYLQEKCGMDPLQLVATSLGQFRPRGIRQKQKKKRTGGSISSLLHAISTRSTS